MARPVLLVCAVLVLLAAGFAATFADAARLSAARLPDRIERQRLTARLGLTDPALFTEARYARHLSQADLHSAFQDHPLALEHFPSGSVVPPPAMAPPAREGPP
ncbi:MAG: hypothetical protein JNK22_07940 [Rhodocyclaceae bacterium]|nr:hypothetical protein [Rhodocyclaceae bacterium]